MGMIPRKGGDTAAADKSAVEIPTKTAEAPAASVQQDPVQQASVPAVQQGGAVSKAVARKMRNPIEEVFKQKIPLEWNTLHRIQANQGNFLDLENNKAAFGSELVIQLMTYQPNWQISPGTDDPDDAKWVRYSDDGKTTKEGEDCLEFLAALKKANYDKAKMSARYTMAFVIEEVVGKPTSPFNGKIVQIDLSATSKSQFDQFMMELGYRESKGGISSDVAESGLLRISARVKTQGKLSWTVVDFALA